MALLVGERKARSGWIPQDRWKTLEARSWELSQPQRMGQEGNLGTTTAHDFTPLHCAYVYTSLAGWLWLLFPDLTVKASTPGPQSQTLSPEVTSTSHF